MNLLLNIRAKYCFLRANGVYYNCQQKGVDRMARNTTNISIRMDADLKAQADALFTELGMNLTTAFNIFVRQSLREGGIPKTGDALIEVIQAELSRRAEGCRFLTTLDSLKFVAEET